MLNTRRFNTIGFCQLLTAAVMVACSTQAAAVQWDIRNLGTVPGATFSAGSAINDLGQVAGDTDLNYSFDPESGALIGGGRAFLSGPNGGPLTVVDEGEPNQLFGFTAMEVNNAGQIVGSARSCRSCNLAYSTGPDGDPLQNIQNFSVGVDINNGGLALYQNQFGAVEVVAPDGTITQVVESGPTGIARGINDAGQVALISSLDFFSSNTNGLVWSETDGFRPILADGTISNPYDINNAGQVLGHLRQGGSESVFIADADGIARFLNLPAGNLVTIEGNFNGPSMLPRFNDAGQVIGQLQTADGARFSFVTAANGGMLTNLDMQIDIINAGWSNLVVRDINNAGQITGSGTINGTTRAFLLTPVPEPETYALMLAGMGIIVWAGKRRKTKFR